MFNFESRWLELRRLDELAAGDTKIHRLNPCIKIMTTAIFLIVVASFSKYEVSRLLPLFFYPVVLMNLAAVPFSIIAKRVLIALPFVVFIGIFNPLLDHTPSLQLGPLLVTNGWISFISILLRFILAISAALILVATTGMDAICSALLKMHIPRVFVIQLMFLYRYLYVLLEELFRTLTAYSLRSLRGNGLRYQVWGSLLGQLLLRTIDRAQKIYQAMLCRGFDGEIRLLRYHRLTKKDIAYVVGWSVFFLTARMVNIPQWLGALLVGRH
ncbi:MAG: ecfT 5 [Firmicutes bacterium]|nr:ecfT 5 [Bacillota bacterium]